MRIPPNTHPSHIADAARALRSNNHDQEVVSREEAEFPYDAIIALSSKLSQVEMSAMQAMSRARRGF